MADFAWSNSTGNSTARGDRQDITLSDAVANPLRDVTPADPVWHTAKPTHGWRVPMVLVFHMLSAAITIANVDSQRMIVGNHWPKPAMLLAVWNVLLGADIIERCRAAATKTFQDVREQVVSMIQGGVTPMYVSLGTDWWANHEPITAGEVWIKDKTAATWSKLTLKDVCGESMSEYSMLAMVTAPSHTIAQRADADKAWALTTNMLAGEARRLADVQEDEAAPVQHAALASMLREMDWLPSVLINTFDNTAEMVDAMHQYMPLRAMLNMGNIDKAQKALQMLLPTAKGHHRHGTGSKLILAVLPNMGEFLCKDVDTPAAMTTLMRIFTWVTAANHTTVPTDYTLTALRLLDTKITKMMPTVRAAMAAPGSTSTSIMDAVEEASHATAITEGGKSTGAKEEGGATEHSMAQQWTAYRLSEEWTEFTQELARYEQLITTRQH